MNGMRLAVLASAAWGSGAMGQQIVDLGLLPGATTGDARGVSADGSVVVGSCSAGTTETTRAFRWTAAGGMQDLGLFPGATWAAAMAVSADGSAVSGSSGPVSGYNVAFRWTASVGMQNVSGPPGWNATGSNISGDGQVVAGTYLPAEGLSFRWTAGAGVELLGVLFNDSYTMGVNGDGSVIVGVSAMWSRAFRWTLQGGMQNLVPGGLGGVAWAVSADGQVVVGTDYSAGAFRWTPTGGVSYLRLVPGAVGVSAYVMSRDASTILGSATFPKNQYGAVIWKGSGCMPLAQYLIAAGVDLTGWTLTTYSPTGVSDGGRVIVGSATRNGAQRAVLIDLGPNPPAACYANCDGSTQAPQLNIADFACFLNRFASGSPYANCDNSWTAPTLDVQDFQCFLNAFAAGCP